MNQNRSNRSVVTVSRDLRAHPDHAVALVSADAWFCVEIDTCGGAGAEETSCRFATALAAACEVDELLEYQSGWYALRMREPATLAAVDTVVQGVWAETCQPANDAGVGT